jgi:hypothetical protein
MRKVIVSEFVSLDGVFEGGSTMAYRPIKNGDLR